MGFKDSNLKSNNACILIYGYTTWFLITVKHYFAISLAKRFDKQKEFIQMLSLGRNKVGRYMHLYPSSQIQIQNP